LYDKLHVDCQWKEILSQQRIKTL